METFIRAELEIRKNYKKSRNQRNRGKYLQPYLMNPGACAAG